METEKHGQLRPLLQRLTERAIEIGATSSAVISSKDIQSKDELAALCNGDYICSQYGLTANCPPNVEGPTEFRKWQTQSKYSITVKIELPTRVIFSHKRNDVMKLLHQIVATVELDAIAAGFSQSKGFAGGSCKNLFCDDQEYCCVLHDNSACPHKESARPSISGFGIDAVQLMKASGWSAKIADKGNISDNDGPSWLVGIIMLA